MKTALEIIVALTTSILFSGALVGAAILGACAGAVGSGYWIWRRMERRIGKRPPPDQK